MVARSAYDQLNYSPLLLAGTVIGMPLTYLLPPLFAIFGTGLTQAIGAITWGLMAFAFLRLCASTGCRHCGPPRFLSLQLYIWYSRSTRRCSIGAAGAGFGKGACRRAVRRHHDSGPGLGGRREDASRREFSRRVAPRFQTIPPASILAFYRFARAADDVADHPQLSESEKIPKLDQFEETLLGKTDAIEDALPLRAAIAERGLSPKHGQDLLVAFRMDASKQRYADWDDLIHYCSYSAMPVGRFVLDVHGESRATWPANDALCAAFRSSITCRIAGRIIAASTACTSPSTDWPRGTSRSKRSLPESIARIAGGNP